MNQILSFRFLNNTNQKDIEIVCCIATLLMFSTNFDLLQCNKFTLLIYTVADAILRRFSCACIANGQYTSRRRRNTRRGPDSRQSSLKIGWQAVARPSSSGEGGSKRKRTQKSIGKKHRVSKRRP